MNEGDEYIDSRDVIARIAELEADDERDDDDNDELDALRSLAEEGEAIADWSYGEQLIREDVFVDYAQQLADDIGAIDSNAAWPLNHIDWEAAAAELRTDYTELTFGSTTYLAR